MTTFRAFEPKLHTVSTPIPQTLQNAQPGTCDGTGASQRHLVQFGV